MRRGDALVIGVGTFRADVPAGEEVPVGAAVWPALEFVQPLVPRVRDALAGLGYQVRCHVDPVRDDLPRALAPAGGEAADAHRIVHVISHGRADPARMRLDLVPSDGLIGRGTNVAEWISDSHAEKRLSLFLVDLCGSGVAARLPSSVYEAGQQTYAWVISASDGSEEAYDGRFSAAVADVLDDLARTGLGSDPSQEYVDFHLVARHIGMRLEAAGGRLQTVRATLMDPSAPRPVLPFFPNPAHPAFAADPVRARRTVLDPPVREFLEEVDPVDARHFTDKPGRHFTGRRSQLRLLAPWLDDPGATRLCVVTGSPGTGKSALLGALMCAAHVQLAEQAAHIRERLASQYRPAFHERLAAVQARQRTLDAVLYALARQLHLTKPEEEWTSESFADALKGFPDPPVLVVDALDEAANPGQVTESLILPLSRACRADGRPLCRLLLGMRPWEEFHQIRSNAAATGLLIDLDRVPADELEEDLAAYLDDALSHIDGYRYGPHRPVREHLARTAATRLARTGQQGEKWGEFLVASVFTSYLASTPAAADVPAAQRLGGGVPVTLPEVLELDLAARSTPAAARSLLVAIAHAKGNGMPAELAFPLAHALHPAADTGTFPRILDESTFYLRTHVDTDGTTLYRPFHQGLADHLRAHPYRPADQRDAEADGYMPAAILVLDTLLASRTTANGIAWANAAPYLLRHAIQHAADTDDTDALITDAEFLVHADPYTLTPALHTGGYFREGQAAAAVYRASLHHHRSAHPEIRRSYLATDAARHRATRLHHRLTQPLPPESWRPRWATASALSTRLYNTLNSHSGGMSAVACTTLEGRAVVVTGGDDGVVRVWDLSSGRPVGRPLTGHTSAVSGVAAVTVGRRTVAVSGDNDGTVLVWDLGSGRLIGQQRSQRPGAVSVAACRTAESRALAVTGSRFNGALRVWDLSSEQPVGERFTKQPDAVLTVDCTMDGDRPVAVTVDTFGRAVKVWDLVTGQLISEAPGAYGGTVSALACGWLRDRIVAVTGSSADPLVRLWDLKTGQTIGTPLAGHTSPVSAVAHTHLDGRALAVTGSQDGTVRAWDLATAQPIGEPLIGHSRRVDSVALTALEGRTVAVTGSSLDPTVRVWDIRARRTDSRPLTGHTRAVTGVACARVRDRPTAVTGSDDGTVRLWDLTSGEPAGAPLTGHTRGVSAVVCITHRDRPLAVTGSSLDPVVRVWDLSSGELIGEPRTTHTMGVSALACTSLHGRPVAVTGSVYDDGVLVWDLASGRPVTGPLTGHAGGVSAVACTTLEGRPIAVTGSSTYEIPLRIWDLATGRPAGRLPTAMSRGVSALACATVGGRPIAVSGSFGGSVQAWDLATGEEAECFTSRHGGAVSAVACTTLAGRTVAVTGSSFDRTLHMWDLLGGAAVPVTVGLEVTAAAFAP
ncbi:AAA family ATPase [Streptomyces sp. NPDC012888]|uniref:AAA family ATPase n=1 Tax=Streptomyces sp. NPDC012888 TaxID=3364855 RepID=UPI0036CD6983